MLTHAALQQATPPASYPATGGTGTESLGCATEIPQQSVPNCFQRGVSRQNKGSAVQSLGSMPVTPLGGSLCLVTRFWENLCNLFDPVFLKVT